MIVIVKIYVKFWRLKMKRRNNYNDRKKKVQEGIRPGTYVTLYDGSQGIVSESDRRTTTIKELKYQKEFDSYVTMTTSQAKQLINKVKQ